MFISLGGFFEFYKLFSTAYVVPGLVRSGILTHTTAGFFGMNGIASYIAATFAGMFLGTIVFGFVSDRAGRRSVFTYSLLLYSAVAVLMACQSEAGWPNFWRLMTGIGLCVELVMADAYLSELVHGYMRGRAFAVNQFITYLAVPVVAFVAWQLVPGYGNELNVTRTVREHEARGVAGIHIEDQVAPKRCGHLEGKEVVSRAEFVSKIGAAVAARRDPAFTLIARTDARATAGLDEAVWRANAALDAEADMAFVEAAQTVEEVAAIPRLVAGHAC